MNARFHKNWLVVTAAVVGAFGPVFSLATVKSTSGPANWTLELLNGPGGSAASFAGETSQFLAALTGGFLFGWGAMILCLWAWAYDAAPEGVRRSVVAGLLAWFMLDSMGSLASGNPWNAFFNLLVLLLAVGPLWLPARGVRQPSGAAPR